MSKMNNLCITDLMFGSMEEHDLELQNAISINPEYTEAVKRIEKHYEELKKLGYKQWLEMDSNINGLEIAARDTAFNEGFKLAVKLILSSIS